MQIRKWAIDKVAFYALFISLALAVFFFIPAASVSVDTAKTIVLVAGIFVALSLYLVSVVKRGEFEFLAHKALWAVLFIPLVFLISSLLSATPHVSLVGYNLEIGTTAFVALGFVVLFLTAVFFRTRERVLAAYVAFLAGFALVALVALAKFFAGPSALTLGALTGSTPSPVGSFSDLGLLVSGVAVLAVVALEDLALSPTMKTGVSAAFAAALFILAVVNIKALWIGLFVFALVYLLYVFTQLSPAPESAERRVSYGALILLLVALVFIANPTVTASGTKLGDAFATRFNAARLEVSPTLGTTMAVIKPVIGAHALFGSGPNTFESDWLTHKPVDINQTVFWNTNFSFGSGLLPTFAATTGLLGILLWAAFLVLYLFLGVKAVFARSQDPIGRFFLTSAFVLSLFLWLMFIVTVPSKAVFILAFFFTGLFFAAAAGEGIISRRSIVFRASPRLAFVAVLLLVALLIGNVAYAYTALKQSVANIYFGRAIVAANQGSLESARAEDLKAINLSGEDIYYNALAQIGTARVNQILGNASSTPNPRAAFQSALQETIAAARAATQVRPDNYANWVALGALYESLVPAPFSVQGSYESAKAAYTQAAAVNPTSPEPYYLLARLEVANKNTPAARDYIKRALAIKPDYADAYYLLTQIEVGENNTQEAIKSAEALALLAPNNAGVFFELGVLKYNVADYQGAAQALDQALIISPDYADAKYFYGLSLYKLGQKDAALSVFKDIQKTNPDNQVISAIIANLEAGRDPLYKLSGSPQSQAPNPPIAKAASSTPARK